MERWHGRHGKQNKVRVVNGGVDCSGCIPKEDENSLVLGSLTSGRTETVATGKSLKGSAWGIDGLVVDMVKVQRFQPAAKVKVTKVSRVVFVFGQALMFCDLSESKFCSGV